MLMEEKYRKELLDSSSQRIKRFFVLTYNTDGDGNCADAYSFKKYSLPRVKTENYNIEVMEEIFMINQLISQLNNTKEVRKVSTGQGDGSLLDFAHLKGITDQ